LKVHVTGWSTGLDVTADGEDVVSHAGLALLRQLADKTGLTGGLSGALACSRLLIHDRGRVMADLACAIADGSKVIGDFRVLADQKELFGLVASVPTTWRTLSEVAAGGPETLERISVAVHDARHRAWAAARARHGALPGVRIADKVLEGVSCIRLDATVTPAHSDKELAEPDFKRVRPSPLLSYCDNTGEPLAGMIRRGGAGSNTVADHLRVLEDSIAALPPAYRRQLMVSCDGAGASHGLIVRLDALTTRPGYQLVYSVGWDLGPMSARRSPGCPRAPGRSRSITAASCGSAVPRTPVRTGGARMRGAGAKQRTSAS
jgi:Transposase DDE domain group 1